LLPPAERLFLSAAISEQNIQPLSDLRDDMHWGGTFWNERS